MELRALVADILPGLCAYRQAGAGERPRRGHGATLEGDHGTRGCTGTSTANFHTNIIDFRGFDSSISLIQRGRILRSIGDFPESQSQAI